MFSISKRIRIHFCVRSDPGYSTHHDNLLCFCTGSKFWAYDKHLVPRSSEGIQRKRQFPNIEMTGRRKSFTTFYRPVESEGSGRVHPTCGCDFLFVLIVLMKEFIPLVFKLAIFFLAREGTSFQQVLMFLSFRPSDKGKGLAIKSCLLFTLTSTLL